MQARVLTPPMFMAHDPQMPSLQDLRNVTLESISQPDEWGVFDIPAVRRALADVSLARIAGAAPVKKELA